MQGLWAGTWARPYDIQFRRGVEENSLPLDGRRGLRADVEDDPGDPPHLVCDATGHLLEEVVGQARPVRGHRVDALHDADGYHVGVVALVADDADRLDRQEDAEG